MKNNKNNNQSNNSSVTNDLITKKIAVPNRAHTEMKTSDNGAKNCKTDKFQGEKQK